VIDGDRAVKSCTMFAVQADGREIMTVEGLAAGATLHPLQQAFGISMGCNAILHARNADDVVRLLGKNPDPSEAEIREGLSGNLCRCTGYQTS